MKKLASIFLFPPGSGGNFISSLYLRENGNPYSIRYYSKEYNEYIISGGVSVVRQVSVSSNHYLIINDMNRDALAKSVDYSDGIQDIHISHTLKDIEYLSKELERYPNRYTDLGIYDNLFRIYCEKEQTLDLIKKLFIIKRRFGDSTFLRLRGDDRSRGPYVKLTEDHFKKMSKRGEIWKIFNNDYKIFLDEDLRGVVNPNSIFSLLYFYNQLAKRQSFSFDSFKKMITKEIPNEWDSGKYNNFPTLKDLEQYRWIRSNLVNISYEDLFFEQKQLGLFTDNYKNSIREYHKRNLQLVKKFEFLLDE